MILAKFSLASRRPATLFASLLLAAMAASAAAGPLLVPAASIRIPDSKGKFDFLAVDPARHRLLAAHEKDGTADFIDLRSGTILARLKTGPTVGIVADAAGATYYASVQDDQRVAIIDAATLKETGSVKMPGDTDAILFDAKDARVYVTNDNGKYLWAIDPVAGKVTAAIEIPGEPECMAHDAATDRIYLNIKTRNEVAVIDTKTNTVIAQWPAAPVTGPHGLVLDAARHRIYVSGDNGKLVALDTTTGAVIGSTEITAKVDQIAFDAGTGRIFCAGPDHLSVVETTDSGVTFVCNVDSAATAKNVAVDPTTHQVWTTYTDGTDSYAKSWSQP
jgi:DNA-binding beta-propeller fold protein YncE